MKGKRLLKNTALMTVSSLVMRALGLWFQVYLSRRIGPAGVGLATLVASVGSLAATFAISGIRFATTRLVSEEVGRGGGDPRRVVRRCLTYAAVAGTLASLALYGSAEFIALRFLRDPRTVLPLRILSVSLPFVSAGAVLGGYFTGLCRVGRAVAGSASEQAVRMAVSWALLSSIPTENVELMCASVSAGGAAGEICSFFVLLVLYIFDSKRRSPAPVREAHLTSRMLGIAMPLALTAYARVALNTVRDMLIPAGLRASGATAEAALAAYGTIQGMVFPVITFPMVLFASLSELLVPELTEEQVQGNAERIRGASTALISLTFAFSTAVAAWLMCFARELGTVLYGSAEAGRFILLLAPLMPVMYMDNVTDGMLRGLGQHIYSMGVNIVDSLLTTALIWLLLPRFAVYGYVAILYASEVFNFALSMGRLRRVAGVRPFGAKMAASAGMAAAAAVAARVLTDATGGVTGPAGLICGGVMFGGVYAAGVRSTGAGTGGEVREHLG